MKRGWRNRLSLALGGRAIKIPNSDQLRDDLRAKADWSVGDMAECLNCDGTWFCLETRAEGKGPASGEVNKVVGIGHSTDGSVVALEFSRYPGRQYISTRFRKITPKADAIERSDSSFTNLVRRRSCPADQQPPVLKPERHRENA